MPRSALEITQHSEPIAREILKQLQTHDVEVACVVVYLLQRMLQLFLDTHTNAEELESIHCLIDDIEEHLELYGFLYNGFNYSFRVS